MRRCKTFLALLLAVLLVPVPGFAQDTAEAPAQPEPETLETVEENDGLLPNGFTFTPPAQHEINFGRNAPGERLPVKKDARVVAVIFSVAQHKSMRKAFPEIEQIDLMPIGGRPMIEHVIAGLKTSAYVDRIIVVGDEALRDQITFGDDPMITYLVDHGDAAENLKHGIHEIARDDLILVLPSDLVLIDGEVIDPLVEHARENEDIDVFFPLVQREHTLDTPAAGQLFIPFKEGPLTAGHVELVRPALFVDNAEEVKGEKKVFYDIYGIRTDAIGIIRFLGLTLSVKFVVRQLSPSDVVRQIYVKYHVRAQGVISHDTRLVSDVYSSDVVPELEALLGQRQTVEAAHVAAATTPATP